MDLSFETNAYNKLIYKSGVPSSGTKGELLKILIPLAICWLPLAVFTLIHHTFWTGNIAASFISSFDTQARLLIAMPVFLLVEKTVGTRLGLILNQFSSAGIIKISEIEKFDDIVKKTTRFLKSNWTDLAVLVICYVQVYFYVTQLNDSDTQISLPSWQLHINENGNQVLNFAGWWSVLISRPFVLYLFYRWLLRILVWGKVLFNISSLDLNLFPQHPDLSGGMGFVGYSLRYFAPVAFGISAILAGVMADLIITSGYHVADFKIIAGAYLVIITLILIVPMISFMGKLIAAREQHIFENNDVANGMYHNLKTKWAKGYYDIKQSDLEEPDFSTVTDMSSIVNNVLHMKALPFTLKDILPLWITAAIPFVFVMAIEVPLSEIVKKLMAMMM